MDTLDTIEHWRARTFSSLLNFVLVFGVVTALASVWAALERELWPVVVVDLAALGWLLAIWWCDGAAHAVRVGHFLALIFLVGVGLMITVGPISQVYLLAAPVLATVLLGLRPALWWLACASLAVFTLSFTGIARLDASAIAAGPAAAAIVALNFLFVGGFITTTCAMLQRGLIRSLERVAVFARSLEQGKNELQAVNNELRLTAAAVARLNEMVAIVKADRHGGAQPIIFVNDAFEKRSGYQRSELLGREWDMLLGAEPQSRQARRVALSMAKVEQADAELLYHSKSGEPYWVELELVPFADEGGVNTHWVAVGRDVTDRKKVERHIHQLAYYDGLTGLPNRRLLVDRIEAQLAAVQTTTHFGAILLVDLDRFKYINDARGHATGDALLRHAAERLAALAGKDDTVARIGGDEFVILLPRLSDDFDYATVAALATADKVRAAIAQQFDIDGQSYSSSASVGVALLPKSGQTAQDLLREADTAMHRAKLAGRNRVSIFETTMRAEVEQRLALERDLAAALRQGELAMHAQLQVDCAGAPHGVELLARWRRADGSFVSPERFIPVAEETGLIQPLGQWALREACLALCTFTQAGFKLPVSVNVSPSQFRQPDFLSQVRAVLAETRAPAYLLIFELTESLLVDNLEGTLSRMHELAALGIRLSIDDFGTGYSSLAYLRRMPLFELKIDRTFIQDAPGDENGKAIVQSILAMASHLGLRATAEGVETQEQASFLAANGAAGMQGYLFARPMPLPDLINLLNENPRGFVAAGTTGDAATAAAA